MTCQRLPATSSTLTLNPNFLRRMTSYDVASNVCWALAHSPAMPLTRFS